MYDSKTLINAVKNNNVQFFQNLAISDLAHYLSQTYEIHFRKDNLACYATRLGRIDILRVFLKCPSVFTSSESYGELPLYIAASLGYQDIIKLLIDQLSHIDQKFISDATALHIVCYYGHIEIVKWLLKNNANVNSTMDNGVSALYLAAQEGHAELVELLIEHGANIETCKRKLYTPLFIASKNGHHKVVKILLSKGASIITNNLCAITIAFKCSKFKALDQLTGFVLRDDKIDKLDTAYLLSDLTYQDIKYYRNKIQETDEYTQVLIKGLYSKLPIEMLYNILVQETDCFAPSFNSFVNTINSLLNSVAFSRSKTFTPAQALEENRHIHANQSNTPSFSNIFKTKMDR